MIGTDIKLIERIEDDVDDGIVIIFTTELPPLHISPIDLEFVAELRDIRARGSSRSLTGTSCLIFSL